MYITGIYYHLSQKIGLKDNIIKLYLYKVYLTHPWWYIKNIVSPKCHIVNDFKSYYILIINKYSNWIIW